MIHPTPIRHQAKLEIVKQSRDMWKADACQLATALDATALITLHGDRPQQIQAANDARTLLESKRYPVRDGILLRFDVTVRSAQGYQRWSAIGRSSVDVLLDTLNHFDEQAVVVSVRPEIHA